MATVEIAGNVPVALAGMALNQLLAMLLAAQAQGAKWVLLGRQDGGNGECAAVDWVSMQPVAGTVYIGAMPHWEDMDNQALESLDW
jgi:hypothetical protein